MVGNHGGESHGGQDGGNSGGGNSEGSSTSHGDISVNVGTFICRHDSPSDGLITDGEVVVTRDVLEPPVVHVTAWEVIGIESPVPHHGDVLGETVAVATSVEDSVPVVLKISCIFWVTSVEGIRVVVVAGKQVGVFIGIVVVNCEADALVGVLKAPEEIIVLGGQGIVEI